VTFGGGPDDLGGESAPRDPVDPMLARLAPSWSTTRTEDNLAVAFRRIERGRRLRRAGVAGALALGAVALAAAWGTHGRVASRPSLAARAPAGAPSGRLDLPDGSTVALRDARARAVVSRSTPERLEVELAGGAAAFEVPARPARTVVVRTARVEVAILAAKFDLGPLGERVRVSVGEGEVAVTWPGAGAPAKVRAGEEAVFPPSVADEPAEAPAEAIAEEPRAREGALERSRFRMQVARRDYAGAYRSLVAAPGVADHSAEDLMLAADAARLSGHPAAAVPFLRRLLREHGADVRAPVAAFTLGRVLLAELARPAEAADAFALSARLAPAGPLAADALGREVEAAARAGDAARARRVAEAYVARFPNGARAAEVRRAGGLE
jgi:transmembrane sensor